MLDIARAAGWVTVSVLWQHWEMKSMLPIMPTRLHLDTRFFVKFAARRIERYLLRPMQTTRHGLPEFGPCRPHTLQQQCVTVLRVNHYQH